MFNESNSLWLYLIGILAMFGILAYSTANITIPLFYEGEITQSSSFGAVRLREIDTDQVEENDYLALIETNIGDIRIELYENNAPENVQNFINLSRRDYYNGIYFHRYVPNKILQGGDRSTLDDDPSNDGQGSLNYVVKDEINLASLPLSEARRQELLEDGYGSDTNLSESIGRIAPKTFSVLMANDGPNTNGAQLFILLEQNQEEINEFYTGRFTVIGEVRSENILSKLANIGAGFDDSSNISRPSSNIIIETIRIIQK